LKACDVFAVQSDNRPWAWWVHQFWFNFVGSLFGWAALWFLARKVWLCISTSCPAQLDLSDGLAIFMAFVGITGHLPYAVAGVLQGIRELAGKVSGLGK